MSESAGPSAIGRKTRRFELLDWVLTKWMKNHGLAFLSQKVVVYGKEWTGSNQSVEREALVGWRIC
ncbi:hypothetical protein A7K93_04090 [Candidatus Methylacidiphilum fumarolicum]|nr:hypothetical protein [Candidatus Methylacidiphilum fumarolicum]MBW6414633.1 hypothetical protein [Candidatus Methylacidiphilum fumarolicum]TFE65652.1 hypothetical protein A7K73_02355 [Candidatus Methylacidiphilum fumarolicum]TFE74205.1 hypothetical protein A7K93_04090 [Candidatus Methylacidiphilum fumarolicum]TFE75704.1 hypothetical protein A7K72_00770 [Candidatus Methylacidiphilum fumarolicum]TFE75864.1 hypothetical protein A7D33_00985 [Candidatus Methylacidiphilum fumarolicum]